MDWPPASETPVFALRDVGLRYGRRQALAGIGFTVRPGERVALVGPSGAGKSSILGLCNGSLLADEGQVLVLEKDPTVLAPRALRALQSRIGTIHQQLHLVDNLAVVHNVNAGRLGRWRLRTALWSLLRPQGLDQVHAALEAVGIGGLDRRPTASLSGGERQRVAIARVLVQEPVAILADEPISSLDPEHGRVVMDLLARLCSERGLALLVSLHQVAFARSHADRVIGLRAGRMAFDLPVAELSDLELAQLYDLPDR